MTEINGKTLLTILAVVAVLLAIFTTFAFIWIHFRNRRYGLPQLSFDPDQLVGKDLMIVKNFIVANGYSVTHIDDVKIVFTKSYDDDMRRIVEFYKSDTSQGYNIYFKSKSRRYLNSHTGRSFRL